MTEINFKVDSGAPEIKETHKEGSWRPWLDLVTVSGKGDNGSNKK